MKKEFKKEVMEKIEKEDVRIHSKNFFKTLKILAGVALVTLGVVAIYLINLSIYLPRRGLGPRGSILHPIMFATIPWGLLVFGGIIVGLMIYIYVKHEGGYKKSLLWTTIAITGFIIILSFFVSTSRLNEKMEDAPHFRRMYDWSEGNFVPGGRRRLEREKLPFQHPSWENLKYFN